MYQRRSERDRGTISVLAVAAMVAVIASATLAVDLGRVAFSSQDQQGATDRAALDAVRAITDLWDVQTAQYPITGTYDAQDRAENLAASSLSVNLGASDGTTGPRVQEVHIGTWDPDTNQFYVWNGTLGGSCLADYRNCFPTAVFVETVSDIDTLFVGSALTDRTNAVVKEAIVCVANDASLKVGSSLATFDATDAELANALLLRRIDASLDVLSYNGLVNAHVQIGRLLRELGVTAGTPDAVVEDMTVSVRNLFLATAQALNNQGDAASVEAATRLTQLAADADATSTVRLGDMLDFSFGDAGSVGDVEMNVWDLVRGSVVAASGSNFVQASGVGVTIPRTSTIDMSTTIIEKERAFAGEAGCFSPSDPQEATTSQLATTIDATLDPITFGLFPDLELTLPLRITGANATAGLTRAHCVNDGAIRGATTQTTTDAASIWLGGPNPGDWATIGTLNAPLLGTHVATIQVRSQLTLSGSSFSGEHGPTLPETVSGGGQSIDWADLVSSSNFQMQLVQGPGWGQTTVDVDGLRLEVQTLFGYVLSDMQVEFGGGLSNALGVAGITVGSADTTVTDVDCVGGRVISK